MWIPIKMKRLHTDLKEFYDDRIKELIRTNSFVCEYMIYNSLPRWVGYRILSTDPCRAMAIEPTNVVGRITEIDFDHNMVNFEVNELGNNLFNGEDVIAIPRIFVIPNKLICFDITKR